MTPIMFADGDAETRDPDAVDFLAKAQLPLSAVVLGLFDQSDDCIKLLDPDGHLRFMNCNGKQAMEIDDFSAIEGNAWQSLWPAESRDLVSNSIAAASDGRLARFEAPCPTAKGNLKWWEVTVSPIHDSQGSVAAILCSSRDVTDRRNREEAIETIAAEMKHRLHNAFTISAGLCMAIASDRPEHRGFAQEFAAKLIGLAQLQAALVDSDGAGLVEIVSKVVAAFDAGNQVETGELPDVTFDERQARALFLVLGELATNSLKYGALSGRGSVRIDVRQAPDYLILEWQEVHQEAGRSVESSRAPGGAGLRLITRMLATIGAEFDNAHSNRGYSAVIRMPV